MSHLSKKQTFRLRIIFIQSLIATLGSLYYGYYGDPMSQIATMDFFNSENALTICMLCWYARILIYPITLISWVALWRKDADIAWYTLLFSFFAIILEAYHYGLQKFEIQTSQICTRANPCNALSVNYFWFITIPLLCLIAAIIIFIASLMIVSKKHV